MSLYMGPPLMYFFFLLCTNHNRIMTKKKKIKFRFICIKNKFDGP